MKELKISLDFTNDDIHMIREFNHERRKGMTFDEYKTDVKKGANEALNIMAELRRKNELIAR